MIGHKVLIGAIKQNIEELEEELDDLTVVKQPHAPTVLANQLLGLYLPVLRMAAVFHNLAPPEEQLTKEDYALRLSTYLTNDGFRGAKRRE